MLELHEWKHSRAVLRGGGGGDVTSLPDPQYPATGKEAVRFLTRLIAYYSNARVFRGRDDIQSTTCNKRSDQDLRRLHGTSPVNSRGAPGRGLRTAGAQRIGKDHDTTASAGALASDVRTGDDLRTGLLASKSAGPPPGLLSSRRAPDVWFDVGTGAAPLSLRPA